MQVAFYKKAKPKHDAKLVYVTKDDFKVFDKNNCQDLTDENLNNYYEEMVRTCLRRERTSAVNITIIPINKRKIHNRNS